MGQRGNVPHCTSITDICCENPWAGCLKMPFSVAFRIYFSPFLWASQPIAQNCWEKILQFFKITAVKLL